MMYRSYSSRYLVMNTCSLWTVGEERERYKQGLLVLGEHYVKYKFDAIGIVMEWNGKGVRGVVMSCQCHALESRNCCKSNSGAI